jgi:hypothetical protein
MAASTETSATHVASAREASATAVSGIRLLYCGGSKQETAHKSSYRKSYFRFHDAFPH